MPSIHKTGEAKEDLINIWLYTYKNWGEKQAEPYLDDLGRAFQLLVNAPLICRLREELKPPVRIHHFNHHLALPAMESKAKAGRPQ